MAGGASHKDILITLGGTTIYDIVDARVSESSEQLRVRGDTKLFPQDGGEANAVATAEFTSTDQNNNKTLVNRRETGALVITTYGQNGAGNVKVTFSNFIVNSIANVIANGRTGAMRVQGELVGTSGTEPTLVWATAT